MLRAALIGLALVSLTACTASGPRTPYGRFMEVRANPGKVVATELAFARAAQEDGQWTAFFEYSTDDAIMFVPEAVNAQDWLRGRDNPPQAVEWQPHEVWSSCDGSLAVTRGAWQRADGTFGYFTTIWERQPDGSYRWVLDQGDVLSEPLEEPEFVQTTVADCQRQSGFMGQGPADPLTTGGGASADLSLAYLYRVEQDLSRTLAVTMVVNGETETVLDLAIAAPE